jgi:hypothetical protein
VPPPADAVTVEVRPPAAEVRAGGAVQFTPVVSGAVNTGVTWEVVEAGGGTVDATGRYLAPGTAGTYHVRARSVAAATATATASVTVTAPPPPPPVTVTVSPATGAVDACRSATFTATVSGTTNRAVTWSVEQAAGGTVTTAGVYTAPDTGGTYHLVARSQADATAFALVPITVTERVLSVAVTPQDVTLAPGASAQFTATVTTTCGSVAAVQTITAPLAE